MKYHKILEVSRGEISYLIPNYSVQLFSSLFFSLFFLVSEVIPIHQPMRLLISLASLKKQPSDCWPIDIIAIVRRWVNHIYFRGIYPGSATLFKGIQTLLFSFSRNKINK